MPPNGNWLPSSALKRVEVSDRVDGAAVWSEAIRQIGDCAGGDSNGDKQPNQRPRSPGRLKFLYDCEQDFTQPTRPNTVAAQATRLRWRLRRIDFRDDRDRSGQEHMAYSARRNLRIQRHASFAEFPESAVAIYRVDPIVFNVELAALTGPTAPDLWHGWLLSAWEDNTVVGAAVRPLAHPLLTSGLPAAAASLAAEALAAEPFGVPGVLGLPDSATAFADTWCGLTGAHCGIYCEETVYRLAELRAPNQRRGAPRPAASEDTGLLVEWLSAFYTEAFGQLACEVRTRALLAQVQAARGQFILWEDNGEPISMARVYPACAGVARIGSVFTPAPQRGRGAGSAVTAAAIQTAQAQGVREIVLNADVTNAAANIIYRNLGFQPITTSVQISFLTNDGQGRRLFRR